MTNPVNAAPRAYLRGAEDLSQQPYVVEPEAIPTHLPLLYTFAQKGDTLPQIVSGASANRFFGEKTFDLRSAFATHQTLMYQAAVGAGNAVALQRVIPDDAPPPANLVLCLDILAGEQPVYDRNADGSYLLDVNGAKIPTLNAGTPVTVQGFSGKWVIKSLPQVNSEGDVITQEMIDDFEGGDTSVDITPVANLMGNLTPTQGDRVNVTTSATSTVYPIRELEINHQGSLGNLTGVRFWAATTKSTTPADSSVVDDNKAFPYCMQIAIRPDATSSPLVAETLFSEKYVEFMDKDGAFNKKLEKELFFDLAVPPAWENLESTDSIPLYGPFGRMHTYYDNIEEIAALIQETEVDADPDFPDTPDDLYLVNLMSAESLDGIPYHTFNLLGPSNGGILLNEYATHYASGGGDGTMTFESFDALVATQVSNFGSLEAKLLDMAKYPISAIWDSGFTLETKKKLFIPMGLRKDIVTIVSTQVANEPLNTASEESSIAIALRAAARLYPESTVHGTSVCRAAVIGHGGNLLQSQWRGIAPLTVDLMSKVAGYMGAGTGLWNNANAFDVSPNNQVSGFRGVNCVYKTDDVRTADWANGLVWVQHFDRKNLFYPGFQTVYDEDNSVLNSLMVAFILADLEKIAYRSWAELSGNQTLTVDQYIQRSDELISDAVRARNSYDGRVVIIPETYLSGGDAARGYSYSCKINMYANNMITVGTFDIVARRSSDLPQA